MATEYTRNERRTQIRQAIADWTSAFCAKVLDRLISHYATDATVFECGAPFQTKRAAAFRRVWEACFPYSPSSFSNRTLAIGVVDRSGYTNEGEQQTIFGTRIKEAAPEGALMAMETIERPASYLTTAVFCQLQATCPCAASKPYGATMDWIWAYHQGAAGSPLEHHAPIQLVRS